MVQLLGGSEIIPGDPAHVLDISPIDVATLTQTGSYDIEAYERVEQQRRESAIDKDTAEKQRQLAAMEAAAKLAHEQYYEKGGTGYGTTPGGPDVYYFDIPFLGGDDPPVYEEGTFFGRDLPGLPGKDDLLLYGALAIGALALLKR